MKKRQKQIRRMHAIGCVLFVLYLIALVYFLFFSEEYGRIPGETYRYNLIPFREIGRYVTNREVLGFSLYAVNLFGNILAFLPFGFFLPVISKKRVGAGLAVVFTFLFSLCVECVQLLTKVGSFDVDDIILNTLGGLLGGIVFLLVDLIRRRIHR